MNSAYIKVLTFPNKRCLFSNKFSNLYSRTFSSHATQTGDQPKRTSLYDLHVNHGAQMEPFAGYSMPIVYNDLNVVDSHIHTRKKCSLFDVSHMLQTRIHGKDRDKLMERLTVADVDKLGPNQSCLTLFTNDEGGIIDDLILTNTSESFLFVVSNAGCADKDRDLMETEAKKLQNDGHDISLEFLNDRYSLIAIQGPSAMSCLQPYVKEDLKKLFFMDSLATSINGIADCRITRCGYTGEDGFEISIPNESAISLSQLLLSNSKDVKLAGLGARDSLRLEAGLCLYGNDIDATTSPVEAGLTWTIGKGRRERKDFPGAEKILKHLKEKPSRRRVGLKSDKKGPPARAGCDILDKDGQKIGKVTSGCPSPSLGFNIAMGYVPNEVSKQGTQHMCSIRKKTFSYDITKMPFVKSNYYTPK